MRQATYAATLVYSLYEYKSIVQPVIDVIREFLQTFFLPLFFLSSMQVMWLIIGLQHPSSSLDFLEQ